MILKLENTTTHQLYEYEVKDMNNGEKLYFRFDIDTSNLVDGEYILSLYDGEKLVANDLLKIGDFNANTLQYKKGENIYIEVKLDESVQDVKNISISTIETTILPDDGFNSMGKVDVNAQPLYDNAYHIGHTEGYNEGLESSYQVGYDDGYSIGNEEGYNNGYNVGNEDGYKQGKTDGINTQKSKLETISITNNGTYEREDGYNKIIVDVPDTNGSYDEGYAEGISNGLAQGEINGINIQKEKLESITITENGTYTREDGYNSIEVNIEDTNGSYDEGYADGIEEGTSNAGEIIAETARVLNITENGVYKSKYSEKELLSPITGKYPNGDNFIDYAYISNRGYNTGIFPTPTTRIEFWWKYDGTKESNESVILGAQKWGAVGSIYKVAHNYGDGFVASINDKPINFNIVENEWHHITMSYREGFFIDGEKIGVFSENLPETSTYEPICINGYYGNNRLNADYYGMVIIDDTIFIPTAEGFLNTTTNEYLPIVSNNNGSYTFTEVEPEYTDTTGNLIKTVNVNVVPKIDVSKTGAKFGYSSFSTLPEWADFSNVSDFSNMFYNCPLVDVTGLDTHNAVRMYNTFYNNSIIHFPSLDTSKVSTMYGMFANCSKLEEVGPIDTSNVTDMYNMFYNFSSEYPLRKLPEFDCGKVTKITQYFAYSGYQNKRPYLTDCGGWKNLKIDWNDGYGLNHCPNLTYQSCINILNGLWDFRGNGDATTTKTLKVHPNFLTTVGDEISIATEKGWNITA